MPKKSINKLTLLKQEVAKSAANFAAIDKINAELLHENKLKELRIKGLEQSIHNWRNDWQELRADSARELQIANTQIANLQTTIDSLGDGIAFIRSEYEKLLKNNRDLGRKFAEINRQNFVSEIQSMENSYKQEKAL